MQDSDAKRIRTWSRSYRRPPSWIDSEQNRKNALTTHRRPRQNSSFAMAATAVVSSCAVLPDHSAVAGGRLWKTNSVPSTANSERAAHAIVQKAAANRTSVVAVGVIMARTHLIAPVLSPQGPVAAAELDLLLTASALMLLVLVPVITMTFWFAWRYRATNVAARYEPEWAYWGRIDAVVWLVPSIIVVVLGTLVWIYTHRLDPYRSLTTPSLDVQAVALDWKWLFIYPEQNIAVVNELAFPRGRAVSLRITSDTVMNAIMIPGLTGQVYAMAGMQSHLNFLAERSAQLTGRNAQYSGSGFPEQFFGVSVLSDDRFNDWVTRVRTSPDRLDASAYQALSNRSRGHPVTYYASVQPGLFDFILQKYHTDFSRTGAARDRTRPHEPRR